MSQPAIICSDGIGTMHRAVKRETNLIHRDMHRLELGKDPADDMRNTGANVTTSRQSWTTATDDVASGGRKEFTS